MNVYHAHYTHTQAHAHTTHGRLQYMYGTANGISQSGTHAHRQRSILVRWRWRWRSVVLCCAVYNCFLLHGDGDDDDDDATAMKKKKREKNQFVIYFSLFFLLLLSFSLPLRQLGVRVCAQQRQRTGKMCINFSEVDRSLYHVQCVDNYGK